MVLVVATCSKQNIFGLFQILPCMSLRLEGTNPSAATSNMCFCLFLNSLPLSRNYGRVRPVAVVMINGQGGPYATMIFLFILLSG